MQQSTLNDEDHLDKKLESVSSTTNEPSCICYNSIKPILNSPGYYVSNDGKIYNQTGKILKTFYKPDGYERIRLPSCQHGKRINHSVHRLVASAWLKQPLTEGLEVNHKDGNKANNHINNLEIVSNIDNIRHAHETGLYTYDLEVKIKDTLLGTTAQYCSLRSAARSLGVSVNYLKPRIIISTRYPIFNRYKASIDYLKYLNHISKLKGLKQIYCYSYISKMLYTLTSYSQLAILYGLPYITIGKKLYKDRFTPVYIGGYLISLAPIKTIANVTIKQAKADRDNVWYKLINQDIVG